VISVSWADFLRIFSGLIGNEGGGTSGFEFWNSERRNEGLGTKKRGGEVRRNLVIVLARYPPPPCARCTPHFGFGFLVPRHRTLSGGQRASALQARGQKLQPMHSLNARRSQAVAHAPRAQAPTYDGGYSSVSPELARTCTYVHRDKELARTCTYVHRDREQRSR
jgi:hypothetical protein